MNKTQREFDNRDKFIELGYNIAYYRKHAGLTQEQLAAQLYVTRQTVSSWEKGRTQPDLDTLRNICTSLDLSPEELLLGNPHTEDSSAALIRSATVCFWGMTALCLVQGILAIVLRMPAPGFYAGALFLCQVTVYPIFSYAAPPGLFPSGRLRCSRRL